MVTITPTALGAWFQTLRMRKGLTQVEVARLSGVQQRTISQFECHGLPIRIDTLLRLLPVIGAAIDLKTFEEIEKERGPLPW